MDDMQKKVNHLCLLLRLQVIEYLLKADRIEYGAPALSDEEMVVTKAMINALPCCTKRLKGLFEDAHQAQREMGMFPHAVNPGELKWCLKNRHIGYSCIQKVKHSWLPFKEDKDLRSLPAFRALTEVYRPLIASGKGIIPPIDEDKVQEEAIAIVNQVTEKLMEEK